MSARSATLAWGCSLLMAASSVSCSKSSDEPAETQAPPPPSPTSTLSGSLDADILGRADVKLDLFADGSTQASIKLEMGHGLLPPGATLEGKGRVEPFAEVSTTLYTARMSAPPSPDGLCGDRPLSLALALRRSGTNARVAGGLSAYCGEGVYHGAPVRIVRLSGALGP